MFKNPSSAKRDCMDYCASCNGEIYYGEGYLDFDGDPIHTEAECIKQYVMDHSMQKVAGE